MPAAYYDISIEEGTSFKLKLKFKDAENNLVDLKDTILIPEGFEEVFAKEDGSGYYDVGVFAKMQVRNSINAGIVELNSIGTGDSSAVSLYGESWKPTGSTPIVLSLSNPGATQTANIKISLSSFVTKRINYGNYLYDLELIYHIMPTTGTPNYEMISEGLDTRTVVFRILQGRFIVTPAISR
jgi:hypothetical protein